MSNTPRAIISLLGRQGSGKGTQAQRLEKETGFFVVRTGLLLRERAEQNDATGRVLRDVLKRGALVPTPLVFSLWMPILESAAEKGFPGIIFDGNPRKLYEAHMLEEVLEMYGWGKRFRAVCIQISEEEARKRMEKRARADDTPEGIEERLLWFRTEVEPVLAYYRERGVLYEVDGELSIEDVFDDIKRKVSDLL